MSDTCDTCEERELERVLAAAPEGHMKEYLRANGVEGLRKMQAMFAPIEEENDL